MKTGMVERTCPVCGQDNNCQHGNKNCWCNLVKIPKGLIDLIPEEKRGKVCICKACIDKYNMENE